MGIEQGDPFGGIGLTDEQVRAAAAKRRAAQEEGHGKREDGVYDLDALAEKDVEPLEPENPESKKAA